MRAGHQHLTGVAGQVAAAVPYVLITLGLSRTEGLAVAGEYAVIAGVGAASFAIAQWGFRTYVVVDRFSRFAPITYIRARAVGAMVAMTVVLLANLTLSFDWYLAASVVLLRAGDAVAELDFAFAQVWESTASALQRFALIHSAKLFVGTAAAIFALFEGLFSSRLLAALSLLWAIGATFVLYARMLNRREGSADPRQSVREVAELFTRSAWFAVATIAAAAFTSYPRVATAIFYEGNAMGVVGSALSVATLFGMIFYTSWIRWLPRFAQRNLNRKDLSLFTAEIVFIWLVLATGTRMFGAHVIGVAFGFSDVASIALCENVVQAAALFFLAASVVNLFKTTIYPWLETCSSSAAFLAMLGASQLRPEVMNIPRLLLLGAAVMLGFTIAGLFIAIRHRHRLQGVIPGA